MKDFLTYYFEFYRLEKGFLESLTITTGDYPVTRNYISRILCKSPINEICRLKKDVKIHNKYFSPADLADKRRYRMTISVNLRYLRELILFKHIL